MFGGGEGMIGGGECWEGIGGGIEEGEKWKERGEEKVIVLKLWGDGVIEMSG